MYITSLTLLPVIAFSLTVHAGSAGDCRAMPNSADSGICNAHQNAAKHVSIISSAAAAMPTTFTGPRKLSCDDWDYSLGTPGGFVAICAVVRDVPADFQYTIQDAANWAADLHVGMGCNGCGIMAVPIPANESDFTPGVTGDTGNGYFAFRETDEHSCVGPLDSGDFPHAGVWWCNDGQQG